MRDSLVFVLLAALLASLWPQGTAQSATAQPPPNVVFLLADDQRPDTIRALGNPTISTPNLDRLVKDGTVFTRAVCANPLCVPSRAEIVTGCSGFRNGILPGFSDKLSGPLAFWPETLRAAGYHTWHVGKWHTSGRPSSVGYEECLGLFTGGPENPIPTFDSRGREITGYRGWMFQTDDRHYFPEKGVGLTPNISAEFADAAIKFLRRKPDRPFILHVSFTAPHDPLLRPPGYERKYDPKSIPLPANYLPEHPFDHGNIRGRDEQLLPWPRTPEIVREELALYYVVISHLDEQIGRILATLEETGQARNTLVIFASDHGLAIGSHGLRGKQNMYEDTIGVPLIVRGPGIAPGRRLAAQVYLRDLFPTVCDLAGMRIPPPVEGKSLVPVLKGGAQSVHAQVFGYFMDTQRMIRGERWKLIHYPKIERYQLFDLGNDPHEMHDLADDPRHGATRAELRGRLRKWQEEVGDPFLKR